MSHELRTPLNAILGYSELIAEEAADNNHDIYINDAEKINSAGKHLLDLISDILDLSKIEAGKVELSIITINLESFIKSILETALPLIEKNNNKFVIDISEDIGEIQNDDMKLKQVIFNLLSNASKFTNEGSISIKVKRCTDENKDWITISVTDTGIGISSDNLEKIFQPFSQADSSTSREYGGTGLGLDISRNFCWLMGGDLKVTSEQGKGSCFLIQIPEKVKSIPEEKSNKKINSDLPLLSAEQVRISHNVDTCKRKNIAHIFLIEQDYNKRENMSLILETDGFKVDFEADMDLALDKITKNIPNAIVINTEISNEKSLHLLKQLASDEKLKKIPVITVVKNTLSDKFITAGAKYQLQLQYDINDLTDKIKQSIRK